MNIIPSAQRSLRLIGCSFQVIARNKKLALFPALTAAFTLFIVLFFLSPIVLLPTGHSWSEGAHWQAALARLPFAGVGTAVSPNLHGKARLAAAFATIPVSSYLYLAVLYFGAMAAATFLNVATFHEILKALAGDQVSLRRGFRFACTRLRAILLWVLVAGTVGLALHLLAERFGFLGRLAIRGVGLAWSVASVFVIPVMIREEETNPFQLLRNSAGILRRNWGESLIGWAGIRVGSTLIVMGWLLMTVFLVVVAVALKAAVLLALLLPLLALGLFGFIYLTSIASQVFQGAVYVYATEGEIPAPFSSDHLDSAWKVKA